MDYFENLIETLLEIEGYWTRSGHRVNLTPEEKRATGKPSIPRPEIDLLGFRFSTNEILVMEVKSYLDSPGVPIKDLLEEHDNATGRYKLFTSEKYRKIVFKRLKEDLIYRGMANADSKITLGLAAGKVATGKSAEIREHFNKMGWLFWSPDEIKEKTKTLAILPYENNAAVITAKVLLK